MLCHTQRRTVKSDQEVQLVPFYVARQDSRLRGVDVAGCWTKDTMSWQDGTEMGCSSTA
jgi:hypothetical protein